MTKRWVLEEEMIRDEIIVVMKEIKIRRER